MRKIALFSTKAIVAVPPTRTNQISTSSIVRICSSSRNFATERHKSGTATEKPNRSIEEILSSIDTTLTSEQQEHVNKLKKQIRGGPNAPRSLYRDVAKPDELVGEGNFFPRLADNAESLIDYALSFIPKKDGYRGSRRKKRMSSKLEIKRENAARRVRQCTESTIRKQVYLQQACSFSCSMLCMSTSYIRQVYFTYKHLVFPLFYAMYVYLLYPSGILHLQTSCLSPVLCYVCLPLIPDSYTYFLIY